MNKFRNRVSPNLDKKLVIDYFERFLITHKTLITRSFGDYLSDKRPTKWVIIKSIINIILSIVVAIRSVKI